MRFAYIGPQIEELLGWTPQSWETVQDWVDWIHVEDRDRVFNYCVSQSQAGVDHEADYRALAKDGSYVWLVRRRPRRRNSERRGRGARRLHVRHQRAQADRAAA